MIMTNSLARIQAVLDQQPALTVDGFRFNTGKGLYPNTDEELAERRAMLLQPEYLAYLDTAIEYFRHFEIDKKAGSYGLKHCIENWGYSVGLSHYVPNGCAILAASMSGYKIVRERNSPNCKFRRELK